MRRCSCALPSCMCCGMECSLGVRVRSLISTIVCLVVYMVYPALCAWFVSAWFQDVCGLENCLCGSCHTR